MLNYKQIWHRIKPIRWLNKFNLTSCVDPTEEPLPSEGVGEHSLLFHGEEEEVMKKQCNRRTREFRIEEKRQRRKQKGKDVRKNIFEKVTRCVEETVEVTAIMA